METALIVSTLIASIAYAVPKLMIIVLQLRMFERQIEMFSTSSGPCKVPEWDGTEFPSADPGSFSDSGDTLSGGYV